MSLISLRQLLDHAAENNYGVPAFNVNNLEAIAPTNYLRLEFYTHATTKGMTGSGLWIINPPYVLAEEGEKMLQELSKIIQSDSASYLVKQKIT